MRYALPDNNDRRSKVHFAFDDEVHMAYCGVMVSTTLRFSRRAVSAIRKRATCGNCAAVAAARKKREAR